jgi:hypothetical protein
MSRPLHFSAFVMNTTPHIIQGLWRTPEARQTDHRTGPRGAGLRGARARSRPFRRAYGRCAGSCPRLHQVAPRSDERRSDTDPRTG